MFNFIIPFGCLNIELCTLLGYRFIPKNHAMKTVVGKIMQNILLLHNSGDYQRRNLEFCRMSMLVKHLKEINKHDKHLFQYFRKELRKADTTDGFFGTRFEINIAASLIRKKVSFKKQESPDFIVYYDVDEIGIECGSVRIRKKSNHSDLFYKIGSAIRSKGSKHYSLTSNALFIDITNILFNINNLGEKPDTRKAVEVSEKCLEKVNFGSVVLFNYLLNEKKNRYESTYLRIDSPNIEEKLKIFLDQNYPKAGYTVDQFIIPHEG